MRSNDCAAASQDDQVDEPPEPRTQGSLSIMACREGTLEAGRGGRSRRREAKGGAYEEIAEIWQAKVTSARTVILGH